MSPRLSRPSRQTQSPNPAGSRRPNQQLTHCCENETGRYVPTHMRRFRRVRHVPNEFPLVSIKMSGPGLSRRDENCH
ncbi:hypothetical protein BJV74DRAFT_166797 [Russula compacta]|nr:hypothetical protein BJV74DRAFT_166797 [Russula compacta]